MPFTAEELEEMARADAEIEAGFALTDEEWEAAKLRDLRARGKSGDDESLLSAAEKKKRYDHEHYLANKDTIMERNRRYREDNLEKVTARQKQYYLENRDKRLDQMKEYAATHKEQIAATSHRYYLKNRGKVLAYGREYREEHKAEIAAKRRQKYFEKKRRRIMEKKLLEMGFAKEEVSGETRYTSDSMGVRVIVGKHGVRMESDHGIPQAVFEAVGKAEKVGAE